MISDTLTTLVAMPYLSLTPELTRDYDERTSLSSFRTVFQLLGAIAVVVAAPMIVDEVIRMGGTQQQGFMLAGAIFGLSALVKKPALKAARTPMDCSCSRAATPPARAS